MTDLPLFIQILIAWVLFVMALNGTLTLLVLIKKIF